MKKALWAVVLVLLIAITVVTLSHKVLNVSVFDREITLQFVPLMTQVLVQENPSNNYTLISSQLLAESDDDEIIVDFFADESNAEYYTTGSIYAYLKHRGIYYKLGDVAYSYGYDSVEVGRINRILEPSTLFLIGSIGTAFTTTKLIAYDRSLAQFVYWEISGKPKLVQFEGSSETLVGKFEGVHLNPPNVYILRWAQDHVEQADVVEATLSRAAVLIEHEGLAVIETTSDDQTKWYKYLDDKLIETSLPTADR